MGRDESKRKAYRKAWLVFLRDSRRLLCAGDVDFVARSLGKSTCFVKDVTRKGDPMGDAILYKSVPAKTYVARRDGDGEIVVAGSKADVASWLGVPRKEIERAEATGAALSGTGIAITAIECANVSDPMCMQIFDAARSGAA